MINLIGLLANVVTGLTIFLSARKRWYAPISGLVAEAVWLYYAYLLKAWPIGIAAVVMGGIYVTAIPKWYRERSTP